MASTSTLWRDMVLVALRSIRGQVLRTSLTVGIIGVGIMALIAMMTATESFKASLREDFSTLGTQSFSIEQMRGGGMMNGRKIPPSPPIDYRQAQRFKKESEGLYEVTVSVVGSNTATLTRGNKKTNPNVEVKGVDELHLRTSGTVLSQGRNFNVAEVGNGSSVMMIGQSIADQIFESWENPIGQSVLVGAQRHVVIGVLEARGATFGSSQNNQILMPLLSVRRQFTDANRSYKLTCSVERSEDMAEASERATGVMRMVRADAPGAENSFRIRQSNQLINSVLEGTQNVTIAAVFIGLITLFGAGIGLMNIMLVSVSERTREIGTRKSLGASSKAIRTQFLVEVMVIGQLGGIAGILLGLLAGNFIASYFETQFVVPWGWMTVGIVLCFLTSLASGYYPARLASKLDPIVALGRE